LHRLTEQPQLGRAMGTRRSVWAGHRLLTVTQSGAAMGGARKRRNIIRGNVTSLTDAHE
jgi:hypothetical protein